MPFTNLYCLQNFVFDKCKLDSQVYVGGEFVGGCDIVIDMHKSGELIEELNKVGIKSDLEDWYKLIEPFTFEKGN